MVVFELEYSTTDVYAFVYRAPRTASLPVGTLTPCTVRGEPALAAFHGLNPGKPIGYFPPDAIAKAAERVITFDDSENLRTRVAANTRLERIES